MNHAQDAHPDFVEALRAIVAERRAIPGVCECFGDSGFQASTHVDVDDVERCDLCGLPCRDQPDDWSIDPFAAGTAFGALAGLSLVSLATALWTARRMAARRSRVDG